MFDRIVMVCHFNTVDCAFFNNVILPFFSKDSNENNLLPQNIKHILDSTIGQISKFSFVCSFKYNTISNKIYVSCKMLS